MADPYSIGIAIAASELTKDRSQPERPWLDPTHPDYERLRAKAGYPRPAASTELNLAAAAEREAAERRIRARLGEALTRADIEYGQLGAYTSGARLTTRDKLRQAALRDLSTAFAGIELERAGIRQQAEAAERTAKLKEAEMAMQASAAKAQMFGQMAAASVPLMMEYVIPFIISKWGGGEAPGASPGLTSAWEGIKSEEELFPYKPEDVTLDWLGGEDIWR